MYVPTQKEPSLGLLLGELEVQSQTQLMNVLTYDTIFTGQRLHAKHLFKKGRGDTTIPSLNRLTVHCGEGKQISKETVVMQRDGDKHREPGT